MRNAAKISVHLRSHLAQTEGETDCRAQRVCDGGQGIGDGIPLEKRGRQRPVGSSCGIVSRRRGTEAEPGKQGVSETKLQSTHNIAMPKPRTRAAQSSSLTYAIRALGKQIMAAFHGGT